MAWRMSGNSTEFCSCKMMCPCWLGPEGEPDQEWCAGGFGFEIEEGGSEGVDLGGVKVALAAEWPGNFFGGQGKARLFLDASASEEQRKEIEAIFSGKKGGMFEAVFGGVIDTWLPSKVAKIDIEWGKAPKIAVDGLGTIDLKPVEDGAGNPTIVTGAMAQGALGYPSMQLASAKGSKWSDPDFREWDPDSGTLHRFDYSA